MKPFASYLCFLLVTGCGSGVSSHPEGPGDADAEPSDSPIQMPDSQTQPPADGSAAPSVDAGPETEPLGLSDISMIIFVPAAIGSVQIGRLTGIDDSGDLVPRDLFARLVTSHQDIVNEFTEFDLLGIRFDLCDRIVPGPCPDGADGSLRLVFQPVDRPTGHVLDSGVHAFYPIPAAQLPAVINELRGIARISHKSISNGVLNPLGPLFSADNARIKALVRTYAHPDGLIRLAVMGQDSRSADLHMVFRAIELQNGVMVDLPIPTVAAATQQDVTLAGADPSYTVAPVADSPQGVALTLSSTAFNAASATEQRSALDALVATQNPLLHTMSTVQCIACHTSTYLGVHRGQTAGIALPSLPSRYTSRSDLALSGGVSATQERSLHAFSWDGTKIEISQRVVNETAQVLAEIAQRFPAPAH